MKQVNNAPVTSGVETNMPNAEGVTSSPIKRSEELGNRAAAFAMMAGYVESGGNVSDFVPNDGVSAHVRTSSNGGINFGNGIGKRSTAEALAAQAQEAQQAAEAMAVREAAGDPKVMLSGRDYTTAS